MPTSNITLYTNRVSGHSHRVELFLSLLALPFTKVEVDLPGRAHKSDAFLAKNPLGQVPVLEDGAITLSDSLAILTYLALRYDESQSYLPRDPVLAAQVQRWFSLAAGELAAGPNALRLSTLFKRDIDRHVAEVTSVRLLALLEATLAGQTHLVGDALTLADIALYAYVAHAPEGGFSLQPYANVRSWLARIEALPRFVPLVWLGAR